MSRQIKKIMKKKKERKETSNPTSNLWTPYDYIGGSDTNLRNKSINHTQQFYKYLIKLHKSDIGNQIYQPLSAAS